MSTIKLTSIVPYKLQAREVSELIGASRAEVTDAGIEITMSSTPLHLDSMNARVKEVSKEDFKYRGLYLLYGNRDVLTEYQFWAAHERKNPGTRTASCEIEFDVGGICPGHVDREILRSFRDSDGNPIGMLNLRRMKAGLQLEVLAKFQDQVKADGGNVELMQKPAHIATRPDLWPQLLYTDPDFTKINVMVIAIADDPAIPGRMRQIAWVRPGTKTVAELQGSTTEKIIVPDWMKAPKK